MISSPQPSSLPIFFKPFADESTEGWLHRLAHANCVSVSQLFHTNSPNKDDWSPTTLVGNASGQLISNEQWEKGRNLPKEIIDFQEAGFLTSVKTKQYCPYCLRDGIAVYERRRWQYKWNYHCDVHHIPLTDTCSHCNQIAAIYTHGKGSWAMDWGHCPTCGKPLAADLHRPLPSPHMKAKTTMDLYIVRMNQLIENIHECLIDPYEGALAIYLAEKLQSDFSINRLYQYDVLISQGVHPFEFVCCDTADLNKRGHKLNRITYESALALAWHLIDERPDVINTLIDNGFLKHLLPEVSGQKWIPIHRAKEVLPEDIMKCYQTAAKHHDCFRMLMNVSSRLEVMLFIQRMYERNGKARKALLSAIDQIEKVPSFYSMQHETVLSFRNALATLDASAPFNLVHRSRCNCALR